MRLLEFTNFVGPCDRLRRTPGGEDKWQEMMKSRREISELEFLKHVDPQPLLDDDETWEQYKQEHQEDIAYYESEYEYFIQTHGFEFIWNKE